jgi:hypothetical protein
MACTYWLKCVRGKNLDAATLVKSRLARFVSFHHILCVSVVSSDKINTTNLLNRIQDNLFQRKKQMTK